VLYTASRTLGRYADEWRLGIGGDLHGHGRAHGGKKDQGVLNRGLEVLGGGSILGGLILGAMAVCIIDRHFMKGAGFALAGAILTFFSFMHGHQIGIADDPIVAFSYLIVAVIFAGCAKLVAVYRSKETIASGPALPQLAE
jgi:adenine/guanine/hypoxanthine permease